MKGTSWWVLTVDVRGGWFPGPEVLPWAGLAEGGGAHASWGEGPGQVPACQCPEVWKDPRPRGRSGPGHTALTTQRVMRQGRVEDSRFPRAAQAAHECV